MDAQDASSAKPRGRMRFDWPCAGCIARPSDAPGARPLLLVFHGDDGATGWLDETWKAPAAQGGVSMVVLRCPSYGSPSWLRWYQGPRYDPNWLGARIQEIAAAWDVDAKRVYATGYSGGASYLSRLIVDRPSMFAAVSLVAGGLRPVSTCADPKTPVHLFIGSLDTMLGSEVEPLRVWLEQCGHATRWRLEQGMTHQSILSVLHHSGAESVLTWLKEQRRP